MQLVYRHRCSTVSSACVRHVTSVGHSGSSAAEGAMVESRLAAPWQGLVANVALEAVMSKGELLAEILSLPRDEPGGGRAPGRVGCGVGARADPAHRGHAWRRGWCSG